MINLTRKFLFSHYLNLTVRNNDVVEKIIKFTSFGGFCSVIEPKILTYLINFY